MSNGVAKANAAGASLRLTSARDNLFQSGPPLSIVRIRGPIGPRSTLPNAV